MQTKLINVTESIGNKLSYFTELERIGSQVNTLSLSRDGKSSLVSTLARLDECILFIENHVLLPYMSLDYGVSPEGLRAQYVQCTSHTSSN